MNMFHEFKTCILFTQLKLKLPKQLVHSLKRNSGFVYSQCISRANLELADVQMMRTIFQVHFR